MTTSASQIGTMVSGAPPQKMPRLYYILRFSSIMIGIFAALLLLGTIGQYLSSAGVHGSFWERIFATSVGQFAGKHPGYALGSLALLLTTTIGGWMLANGMRHDDGRLVDAFTGSIPLLFTDHKQEHISQRFHERGTMQRVPKVREQHWTTPIDTDVLPLPVLPPGLVGRETELRWMKEHMLKGRSIGIWSATGVDGVGKTALVATCIQRHATHYTGGIGVIRAAKLQDFDSILRLLVAKFVPQGPALLAQQDGNTLLSGLQGVLRDLRAQNKPALVVLDDIAPTLWDSTGLGPLLKMLETVGVSVIVTAREEISRQYISEGLALKNIKSAAARTLLIKLTSRFDDQKPGSTALQQVDALTDLLEGHPLALTLTAADLKEHPTITLSDYRQELETTDLALEGNGQHPALPIDRVFALSYDRLTSPARQIFRLLGIVAGSGCTDAAIVALGTALDYTEEETYAALDELLQARLLGAANLDGDAYAPGQVAFHPIIQDYARRLFRTLPENEINRLWDILAVHYAKWVQEQSDSELLDDDENITAALLWARDHTPETYETLAWMIYGLSRYWEKQYRYHESIMWLMLGNTVMQRLGVAWNEGRAYLVYRIAGDSFRVGMLDQARHSYEEALTLFRQQEDRQFEGAILKALGDIALQEAEHEKAKHYYQQGAAAFHTARDRAGEAAVQFTLGNMTRENSAAAMDYFQRSLVLFRQGQDRAGEIAALSILAEMASRKGDYTAALDYYEQCLEKARKMSNWQGECNVLYNLGVLSEEAGRRAEAEGYYHQSLQVARDNQSTEDIALAAVSLGNLLCTSQGGAGRVEGHALLQEAALLFREIDATPARAVQVEEMLRAYPA